MIETPNKRMAPKPELNPEAKREKKEYLPRKMGGRWIIYLDRVTMRPVSTVPESVTFWLAIHRIAWLVRKLTLEGLKASEVRKAVEADYRAFRLSELPKTVRLGRLKVSLGKSLNLQAKGMNSWPDEVLDVEDHPELVAYLLDPTPKTKRLKD